MIPPSEEPSPESHRRVSLLLRAKRHEVPPPGFFRDFAPGVMRRIEAAERESARQDWRHRLNPAHWFPRLAGANGLLLLGVALLGFSTARHLLKPDPSGSPAPEIAAVIPDSGMQFAGPGGPESQGGPTLLRIDPAVLQPVRFPGASNDTPWPASPLPPGVYRIQFRIETPTE